MKMASDCKYFSQRAAQSIFNTIIGNLHQTNCRYKKNYKQKTNKRNKKTWQIKSTTVDASEKKKERLS